MAVQEWLTNAQEYQGFLSISTVEDEAPKFLNDGFYHGELANAMLLAISNALEIPVIVYSSALHHPFVTKVIESYPSSSCSLLAIWSWSLQWYFKI